MPHTTDYKLWYMSCRTNFPKLCFKSCRYLQPSIFKVTNLQFCTVFPGFRPLFKIEFKILNRNVCNSIHRDLMFSVSENRFPFGVLFSSGNGRKSVGSRSGQYCAWSLAEASSAKKCRTLGQSWRHKLMYVQRILKTAYPDFHLQIAALSALSDRPARNFNSVSNLFEQK